MKFGGECQEILHHLAPVHGIENQFYLHTAGTVYQSADHPAPLLFQKDVLPLLLVDDIEAHDAILKGSNPWLLDFDGLVQRDYPQAFQQFQQDPEPMIKVLFAYCDLIDFIKVKRTLATHLRKTPHSWSTFSSAAPAEKYKDLESETNDNAFIQRLSSLHLALVYTEFVAIWTPDFYPPLKTKVWLGISSKIRHFVSLLPPASKMETTDLRTCVSTIRTKTLSRLSESKEQSMNAKIESLQNEKRELEDKIRQYNRAISDLGFRHLTENLPMHASFGGTSSTDRWQKFWSVAWYNNGQGPKLNSPLQTLWDKSDKRARTSIQDAGDKLFNVLSANIHGFGGSYDPQDSQRDKNPGDILKALKPLDANFTGEEVDWSQEVTRFV